MCEWRHDAWQRLGWLGYQILLNFRVVLMRRKANCLLPLIPVFFSVIYTPWKRQVFLRKLKMGCLGSKEDSDSKATEANEKPTYSW